MMDKENSREHQHEDDDFVESNGQSNAEPKVNILDVIDIIAEKVDSLLKYVEAFSRQSINRQRAIASLQRRMTWIAFSIIFLVIVTSGLLTYFEKIDGSTFTFLLGLVVGYVLTFVRDTIQPPE